MTKQEVIECIQNVARAYGFVCRENKYNYYGFNIEAVEHIVNVTINDKWEIKNEEKQVIHHVKLNASISMMGGNPTPEKLMEYGDIIKNAARLCMRLENAYNLSWIEQY